MPFEDRTLTCVGCNEEFVFSADEQAFFADKGFESDPKRCTKCRAAKRKNRNRKGRGNGIYRSPAFEKSAPAHQKVRGHHYRSRGEYRAPASLGQTRRGSDEYRSPAFSDIDKLKPEDEYRAPGFREAEEIDPKEEYRAPGFKEHEDIDPKEEYRSPAYRDLREKYIDQKPMFSITCADCGVETMVPFLPEEKEKPLCKACYKSSISLEEQETAIVEQDVLPPDDETTNETNEVEPSVDGDLSAMETTKPSE